MSFARWPVDVFDARSFAAATTLWHARGQTRVGVVAKARLELKRGGVLAWGEAPEICVADEHEDRDPLRSVRRASDVVPERKLTDVCFVGHAHPDAPTSRTTVRFAVLRDGTALLDKRLDVVGDRRIDSAGSALSEAAVFDRMPLVYERALGGELMPTNLLGRPEGKPGPQPNVYLSGAAGRPGCLAPVSSMWAERRRKRGKLTARAVRGPVFELGDDFDSSFFQHAPADQQLPRLRGDEVLILERLLEGEAHYEARLPAVRAAARIYSRTDAATRDVPLELDALWIDGDARRCTLTFRGSFIAAPAELASLMVQPAITSAGAELTFPSRDELLSATPTVPPGAHAAPAPVAASSGSTESPFEGTVVLTSTELPAATQATPFTPKPTAAAPPLPPRAVGPPPVAPPTAPAPVAAVPPPAVPRPVVPPPAVTPSAPRPIAPAVALPDTAPEGVRPWDRKSPQTQTGGGGPPPSGGEPPAPGGPPPPIDPNALPKRPRECPAILNDSALAAWTLPWKLRKRNTLTVVVKATCDLVEGRPAVLREAPTIPSGDVHVGDDVEASLRYPSDFAIFKPKADVVFNGVAHAAKAGTRATEVQFSFGGRGNRFRRKLAIFGDRTWKSLVAGAGPSEPQRFEEIPLTWEHAYGGPTHPANPVGVGAADDPSNRVPALEDPAKLMRSRGDTPLPTCFAAVAPTWPLRWSKMGTYDETWQQERWPYFPADFDWAHFQAAPLAQQLEHLRGDEPFSVTGVRPGGAELSGNLPGIVPRMFVCRETRSSMSFSELELQLDTVVLDGEAMTVDLVWRGVLEVSAHTAPEVPALFLRVQEPGDPELTLASAHAQFVATLNAPRTPTRELPPTAPANDEAAETSHIDALRDDLRAAGIPEAWFKEDLSPAAIHPTPAELAAARGATSVPVIEDALAGLSARTAAARAARGYAISLLEAGEPLDGVELSGADLSELDFSGKSLVGAKLDGANLRLANFTGSDLTEALLSASDCRGTLLRGANLTEADFVDAVVDDADLSEAELGAARFTRASGLRANFAGAKGERAGFVEGNWTDARFDGAELAHGDWSGAALHGASFEAARVPHLRLYEAEGERVQMSGADISGARAIGVKLRDAKMRQANAAASVWDDAVLERCDWFAADLTEASLCGATCEASNFAKARMKSARLNGSELREVSFVEADLMEASFEDAKLLRTDLRGANLYGAETWNAELEDTRLAGAFVVGTKLEQR